MSLSLFAKLILPYLRHTTGIISPSHGDPLGAVCPAGLSKNHLRSHFCQLRRRLWWNMRLFRSYADGEAVYGAAFAANEAIILTIHQSATPRANAAIDTAPQHQLRELGRVSLLCMARSKYDTVPSAAP